MFHNQREYMDGYREPISNKYTRENNERLHLTINLTNKSNILCLNFVTDMNCGSTPKRKMPQNITYSTKVF